MTSKYVLVTGGLGGIGRATVELLAARNIHVFVADIHNEVIGAELPANSTYLSLDITNPVSIKSAVEIVKKITPGLDGLVNNAGVFDCFPLSEVSLDRFDQLMHTNIFGSQYMVNAFFPLLHQNKGRVVAVSSETGLASLPLLAYGVSKAMLDVWVTNLRMELALLGMKVITIRPGGHKTDLLNQTLVKMKIQNTESHFIGIMELMNKEAEQRLQKIKKQPIEVAKTIIKALTVKNPKREYWVNVSLLYKMLRLIPVRFREKLVINKLKKFI